MMIETDLVDVGYLSNAQQDVVNESKRVKSARLSYKQGDTSVSNHSASKVIDEDSSDISPETAR